MILHLGRQKRKIEAAEKIREAEEAAKKAEEDARKAEEAKKRAAEEKERKAAQAAAVAKQFMGPGKVEKKPVPKPDEPKKDEKMKPSDNIQVNTPSKGSARPKTPTYGYGSSKK